MMAEEQRRDESPEVQPLVGLSPIDVVRQPLDKPDVPMQWSLGLLGDMMWMRLPESRPFLARLIATEVETAIENDHELMLLPDMIVIDALRNPVLRPALDDFPRTKRHLAAILCVIREAYMMENLPGARVTLENYVLEELQSPVYWPIVREVDPQLASLIETEFGKAEPQ